MRAIAFVHAFHRRLDAVSRSPAAIERLFGKSLPLALTIALLAICSPTVAGAQTASLQNLGQVNGAGALAMGVSADGKVVTGELYGCCGTQAFSWVGGTLTPLGFVSGFNANSIGKAVNFDGSVVAGTSSQNSSEAFRWAGGTIAGIGFLPVSSPPCGGGTLPFSTAFGINADGSVIVGQSVDNPECNGDGFLWSSTAGMQALVCPLQPIQICFQNKAAGVSANGSVVVGTATTSGALSGGAWRWVGGNFNVFLGPNVPNCGTGCVSASANGVTPDGNIVVGNVSTATNQTTQAFLWNSTTNNVNYLGQLPGGNTSQGLAVNADGSVVVGTAYDNTEHQKAVIWTAANGMQVLDTVLTAAGVDLTGWSLGQATGVSADGTVIVGYGTGPCNCAAGWLAVLPTPSPLLSAVLPESRSAQPNGTVTAFATIINTGTSTAAGCSIASLNGLPGNFVYQTTNPTTNAVTGSPNTPVNIAAGASQSFVIALTPSAAFAPTNALLGFTCTNVPLAPIHTGLNTLQLSASTTPTPDVVTLAATLQNDGIVHVTGAPTSPNGPPTGVFAVATDNLGSADTITASANTGAATLPLTITMCQTNPTSGQCLQTPSATVTTTINSSATPTFGIFVTASGTVPFDPANSRIFVQFADSGNAVRGETSVAVETQ